MFTNAEEENVSTMILLGTIVLIAFVCFVILLAYLFTTKKNKLLQEKQLMKIQFQQQLLQTQLEIQEQTLKTISEEIHDNVGQVLSLAKLNLSTIGNINDHQLQTKITGTKDLVSKAINDLRDLTRSMHGDRITELGLHQSIADELLILQNSSVFETGLQLTGEVYKLNQQKEMVIFRIVQEALHNAVKHAHATHLKVEMDYQPGSFLLTVSDDGTGFSPEALESSQTGIGLKSMQNRAALIGGKFSIHSSKKYGTSITIELPALELLNP